MSCLDGNYTNYLEELELEPRGFEDRLDEFGSSCPGPSRGGEALSRPEQDHTTFDIIESGGSVLGQTYYPDLNPPIETAYASTIDWSVDSASDFLSLPGEPSPMNTTTSYTTPSGCNELDASSLEYFLESPSLTGISHEPSSEHDDQLNLVHAIIAKEPTSKNATSFISEVLPIERLVPLIKCSKCQKAFTRREDLQKHIRAKHRVFKCNECDKSYEHRKSLYEHRKGVHELVKHHCEHCPYNTAKKSNLERHIKNKHSENQR